MKTRQLVSVLVVAAALSLVMFAGAGAGQMLALKPTVVAVVDIEVVFKECEEKKQIEADLKVQADKFESERKTRAEKMRKLQSDLEMLNSGDAAFQAKLDEAGKLTVENQVWENWQVQKLQRENLLQVQGLYMKIIKATEKLAKDRGYDLILYKEAMPDFKRLKPDDMPQVIRSRKVLYNSAESEVTKELLQSMDNEFRAGMGRGGK